jgi:pimeloyl-ACP methyl ester carboxylesterase
MASRIDIGSGPPLVLIPGLQGRWEWMRPTVDALAAEFRVISYTLAGDWGSDHEFEPGLGFDNFIVPTLLLPVFALESAHRVSPELRAALPTLRDRLRMVPQALRVVRAPVWPRHMRRRMELIASVDFMADVTCVHVPALAITGEPGLDRTVPVELTRRYLDLLPRCGHAVLERSGHMGAATRPREFAALVASFLNARAAGGADARRAG